MPVYLDTVPGGATTHRLPGTDRACAVETTGAMAARAADLVGITRVADVTLLDVIGIPTYQAIRPMSRTLAVSQGKGVTAELARLSAMMESIETWHVEQPVPVAVTASPRGVGRELGYRVEDLPCCDPCLLHDDLPMDWTPARRLDDASETLVPTAVVGLSLEQATGWTAPALLSSTNGLASGNTMVEASLHALYEVVERDAVTGVLGNGRGVVVDPRTSGSQLVDELCARIEKAGVVLEVRFVPSPTGLPCFLSWLACDDYPAAMYGFGCHRNPEIALTRAITEAAQTRLTYVAGARDDLDDEIGRPDGKRPSPVAPGADIGDLVEFPTPLDTLADDLQHVVARVSAAFGQPPLVVDLRHPEVGVPVVKVIAPGARISTELL